MTPVLPAPVAQDFPGRLQVQLQEAVEYVPQPALDMELQEEGKDDARR